MSVGWAILAGLLIFPVPCFICYKLWAMNKRKTTVIEELNNWNTNEGTSRGIYFALGGEDGRKGPSDDDFWLGIYPVNNGQGAVLRTKYAGINIIITNDKDKMSFKKKFQS